MWYGYEAPAGEILDDNITPESEPEPIPQPPADHQVSMPDLLFPTEWLPCTWVSRNFCDKSRDACTLPKQAATHEMTG
jgi:hypothetical protein